MLGPGVSSKCAVRKARYALRCSRTPPCGVAAGRQLQNERSQDRE